MGFLKIRRKQKPIDKKGMEFAIQQSLAPYIKQEDIRKYLEEIEKDEKKKKIWASLSTQKKIKLLRYVVEKRAENAKK